MGIDGIGNGGRIPPGGSGGVGGAGGPSATKETGRTFDVHGPDHVDQAKAGAAQQAQQAQQAERSPVERLRAGEIDVNGYVDLKVDLATKNLSGLSRVELDQIRATLKHQMANDPAVVDLVKQATGAVPSGTKPDGE